MQEELNAPSHVRISDSLGDTYFRLLDMSDGEIVTSIGKIAKDVHPDLYRVQAIRPGGFLERVIRTRPGGTILLTNFEPPFDAPTPLASCTSASPAQQNAAKRTSKIVHVREGQFDARLFLFGRRIGSTPERYRRPVFELRDMQNHVYGPELGEMNEEEGWFAETLDVPPGIYTLVYEVPNLGRRAQLVTVERGWETQVFFPWREVSDFAQAWVHLREFGTGFDPSDPNNLYQSMGGLLEAFMEDSAIFELDLMTSNHLCTLGSKDPMIALIVAYLLLTQSGTPANQIQEFAQLCTETVGKLSASLPHNPDVALLRAAPYGPSFSQIYKSSRYPRKYDRSYGIDADSAIRTGESAPCFARGLEILMRLAVTDSTFPPYGMATDIALRRTTGSIWTRWNAGISPQKAREQVRTAVLEAATNAQNRPSAEDLAWGFSLPVSVVREFLDTSEEVTPRLAARGTYGSSQKKVVWAEPVAFMSYAHQNNKYDRGYLTKFRERLEDEVSALMGTSFTIFQDHKGDDWQTRTEQYLAKSTLLIPIITPHFYNSQWCRDEFNYFRDLEQQTSGGKRILPVYYIDSPQYEDHAQFPPDSMEHLLASYQYADWRELRARNSAITSSSATKTLRKIAKHIHDVFKELEANQPPSPNSKPHHLAGSSSTRVVMSPTPPFDLIMLPSPRAIRGRSREVDRVIKALTTSSHPRIAVLDGIEGIGKTAVAAKAVHDLYDRACFPDGIAVVLCIGMIDTLVVLRHVLTRFNPYRRPPDKQDEMELAQEAHQLLSAKQTLIVLDDIEPQLDIARVIEPLQKAGAALLLTSKHPLPLSRTMRHTLEPLHKPDALDLLTKPYTERRPPNAKRN